MKEFSQGGYVISPKEKEAPRVVLIASGSEVSIALKVNLILKVSGITSRVVSVPDREEFLRQEKDYIEEVLGPKDALRVVIEANSGEGWYQLLSDSYYTVFMKSFGRSAPAQQLADCFGFTPEGIVDNIIKKLAK
jgi:transketolase